MPLLVESIGLWHTSLMFINLYNKKMDWAFYEGHLNKGQRPDSLKGLPYKIKMKIKRGKGVFETAE
jgi:hypothetical protein